MTRPTSYLLRMVVFLLAVGALAAALWRTLFTAFSNNPLLDGLILAVLALGVLWNILQVLRLSPEVRWLEQLRQPREGLARPNPPKLLAPMATMLAARNRTDRLVLSTPVMRSLLDSISSRLDESRELSRYMTGLLIFLGLLGTFYGLLLTVSSISDVIADLSVGSGDVTQMFDQLKAGLAKPLHGMGTAFSGSMFGLAGALVLGFLDLTAGQAQNRFFNELEEWLAGITRFGGAGVGESGDAPIPAYVQGLLEQTAENLEALQRVIGRSEDDRTAQTRAITALADRLSGINDLLRTNQQLMLRVAESHAALAPVLGRLAERQDDGAAGELRGHLRAIEQSAARIEAGHAQGVADLRGDIRLLTRTLAAGLQSPGHGPG